LEVRNPSPLSGRGKEKGKLAEMGPRIQAHAARGNLVEIYPDEDIPLSRGKRQETGCDRFRSLLWGVVGVSVSSSLGDGRGESTTPSGLFAGLMSMTGASMHPGEREMVSGRKGTRSLHLLNP
jgi:hypothetical protein